jgi:hypothetical protein
MAHVGAALKTHLFNSVKNTWNTVYQLAMFTKVTSGHSIEYGSSEVSIFTMYFISMLVYGIAEGGAMGGSSLP